jgi:hypothetical protein
MNVDHHIAPNRAAIEHNKLRQPEGERLRAELTDWLEKNNIVSILLDTPRHCVNIQTPRLPDNIKNVLSIYGSIYVNADSAASKPPKETKE